MLQENHMRQIALICTLVVAAALLFVTNARAQTEPTTQSSGRGARRAAISNSPREQVPFTNGDLNAINSSLPTLFICGDSTAARNNDADHRGWGAVLVDYFDTSKINL